MPAGRPPDWMDVRKLFLRFIFLVLVPVVGLVSFGVVAISNERAVVEQRFAQEHLGRMRALAEHLATSIDETAMLLTTGSEVVGSPLVKFSFVIAEDSVSASQPLDPEVKEALGAAMRASSPRVERAVLLVPVLSGPAHGLYAVGRFGSQLRGLAFSEYGLTRNIEQEAAARFPGETARFTLAGPKEPLQASGNPARRLLDELLSDKGEAGLVSLPLPGALADWRIVLQLAGGDPVRSALVRNRTIYIVALALFYVVITIGVVLTLRGIWREARLSRLKTDFVSNVSHELRTPLTSIRMFAETLRLGRAQSPEEQAACIDFIVKESERLSDLTARTLDWARLEAGRRDYVREPVGPRQLVEEVLATFLGHATLPPERLVFECPEGLPDVLVDRGALGQVLLNLLENAVKYTGEDKRITVRVRADRKHVFLEVQDNGIGIARRDLKRVFDRFYRADDTLARRTEGSGLGLSIARRIVEAHQGRIDVTSRVGHGSTFTVRLPIHRPAATTQARRESLA